MVLMGQCRFCQHPKEDNQLNRFSMCYDCYRIFKDIVREEMDACFEERLENMRDTKIQEEIESDA